MAEAPSQIGRYRVLGMLGTGGMGTVYRARDPLIDRLVAIKVLHTTMLSGEARAEYIGRFRQEAQAAGRCMHPAIVAVYDISSDSDEPYIVMELVEGQSLQQILRAPGGRASLPFVPLLLQVLDGLAFAHRLGVTHRDIKPANIIVTPAGDAKIADFGIARLNDVSLTQAGDLLGTPSYMAPEQLGSGDADQRTDVFSVGAILYEAITGKAPFAGRSAAETFQRLSSPDPASMVAVEAADAGVYVPVLRRALAKPPDQRFPSATAFAAALRAASELAATRDPLATVVVRPPAGGQLATHATFGPATFGPATFGPATFGPSTPGPRTGTGTGTGKGTGTGRWDPATLQRIERTLAGYVGPMARMVVAKAARESAKSEELYRAVADSLQTAADRSAFLRSLGTARVEPTLSPHAHPRAPAEPTSAGPAATGGIPAEAIAAAQSVLAFYVGPIARVLVREAAAQATSSRDFIDRLCAHASKPGEDVTLRRRLRADVEPKLP